MIRNFLTNQKERWKMSIKRAISFIIHPFLSVLLLAFLSMAIAFLMDSNQEKELPFSLSSGDSISIFILGTLFFLYPILILFLAIPSLLMENFRVNIWVRVFVYLVLGAICMIFQTVISKYDYLYLVMALIFTMIDSYMYKNRVVK